MFRIKQADGLDAPKIVALLNTAYRGEESKKGWTSEADLLLGEVRTDVESVNRILADAASVILKCVTETEEIIGCVHLKKIQDHLYLGMLSVMPTLQGKGIGKMFLSRAEEYAVEVGCTAIQIQVISVRTELNDWYTRHGFVPTGERFPFAEDEKFGRKTQPLEFMVMQKKL